ncbi:MAG: hypothetical protein K2G82_03915, partial [Paramuribaculum sp.]|nr:hypothetical protein [Paramuribaculum sp.]
MGNEWKKGGDPTEPDSPAPLNQPQSPRKEAPRGKLHCHNWLADVPGGMADDELVEVQFKNTRKGFFRNTTHLDLCIGDMVAVEASPGHDIGQVTLTGKLVGLQMRRAGVKPDTELKRVFRKAKCGDLEKYEEAKARENDTMIRARKIAADLRLNMKIGDVEYQGDGNKAIFYYIADERVDFRQLIKVLAETFHIRVEMRQIGARQEAGRIGGIGPCGRPLCCASWMTNFVSVGTAAARFQDISLNPQKLAGQCAKLKCCLNFEVDSYVESIKKMPSKEIRLETADATYYHFKYDVFKREITYSTDKNIAANLVTIDADRAFEVIQLNKNGEKPLNLKRDEEVKEADKKQYNDILGQDITRFDKKKKRRKNKSDKGQAASKDGNAPKQREAKEQKEPSAQKAREPREQKPKEQKNAGQQQQKGQKPQHQNGQRQKRRLRPGDAPDNTNLEAGRNA